MTEADRILLRWERYEPLEARDLLSFIVYYKESYVLGGARAGPGRGQSGAGSARPQAGEGGALRRCESQEASTPKSHSLAGPACGSRPSLSSPLRASFSHTQ